MTSLLDNEEQPRLTLNTDVNNGGQSTSNSVGSFAQIISFAGLLDILQHQGPVYDFHIGLDLRVQIFVVLRFVSWTFQGELSSDKIPHCTCCLLPRDLRLGETVGLTVYFGIAALGKLLVCRLHSPPGRN